MPKGHGKIPCLPAWNVVLLSVDFSSVADCHNQDEQSVVVLRHSNGALAALTASVRNYLPSEAMVIGTRGQLRIHAPFYRPHRLSVTPLSAANLPGWASPKGIFSHEDPDLRCANGTIIADKVGFCEGT